MQGIDGPKRAEIITRQLCHFFCADIGFGLDIAQRLGLDVSAFADGVQAHKVNTVFCAMEKPALCRLFLFYTRNLTSIKIVLNFIHEYMIMYLNYLLFIPA